MKFDNGYFYNKDGSRYFPLGIFGNYFEIDHIEDEFDYKSYHGQQVIEFQNLPRSVWRRFFQWLNKNGYTALRLFPRGVSIGSAWEGLDLGGKLNMRLYNAMMKYISIASEYGLKTQLCLFTEPECSVYCNKMTRLLWGTQMSGNETDFSSSQQRFYKNSDDIVKYSDYFSDPDVISCNLKFLNEIIPLIKDNQNIFLTELFNEIGWASPHADVANTFRWEMTDKYLSWNKIMISEIKKLAPDLPVCISNPGVGIIGHDTVLWGENIKPDIFSIHIYPDCCGHVKGFDFATMADMVYKYTSIGSQPMYGEWQCTGDNDYFTEHDKKLLARDMIWLNTLSGAPGTVSWLAESYGEYAKFTKVANRYKNKPLKRKPAAIKYNVKDFYSLAAELLLKGADKCQFTNGEWCPDNSATDKMHRFCVKAKSKEIKDLISFEFSSLLNGVDFDFVLDKSEKNNATSKNAGFSPINKINGYHIKYFMSETEDICLVYLRNYVYKPYFADSPQGSKYEKMALRTQKETPLLISHNMPEYNLSIYDLDEDNLYKASGNNIDLGLSSHDYVLIFEKNS